MEQCERVFFTLSDNSNLSVFELSLTSRFDLLIIEKSLAHLSGMSTQNLEKNDHDAFKERLLRCIVKLRSANALSHSAGIPQSTFQNYLGKGEPNRPKLVSIARAAGVSVEWLASGAGNDPDRGDMSISLGAEEEAAFQARFNEVVSKRGGITQLAHATEIPIDRLSQVKAGGELTRGELLRIGDQANVPLHWLITGREKLSDEKSGATNPDLKFVAGIKLDPDTPQPRWAKSQGESWYVETPDEAIERMEVMGAILRKLPKGPVFSYEVEDDTMAGDFVKGDMVVIDGSLKPTLSAVYLFETIEKKKRFLARATLTDKGIVCGYTNPYYDRTSRFDFSPDTHACLGRVSHKLTAV